MKQSFETLKVETSKPGLLPIALNRPKLRNALDTRMGRERRAKELILGARPFSAEEALSWGMVDELAEPGKPMPRVPEIDERISGNAPVSVRQAKKSIHYGMQMDLRLGLDFEVQTDDRAISTEDRRESMRAFNDKRKPKYTGR